MAALRAWRGPDGAILCGPRRPTSEDLRIVADFDAWLRGDRSKYDNDFREVKQDRGVNDGK